MADGGSLLCERQLSFPGKSNSSIGRYFCEHPHLRAYTSSILDWEKFRQLRISSRVSMVHAIALSSEFSKAHGLISATFSIDDDWRPVKPASLSKNLLGRSRKVLIKSDVTVRAEMSPDVGNRVTLSNSRRDRLGQPIAHAALKFDPRETLAAYKHLNSQLVRSGLGRMGTPRRVEIWGGGHFMGTTRMGNDPMLSVTDAQGRVHGVKNLYVAGSSLFPAPAAANPTFTIVALSLRLAAHLAKRKGA